MASIIERATRTLDAVGGVDYTATASTITVRPSRPDGFVVSLVAKDTRAFVVSYEQWVHEFDRPEDIREFVADGRRGLLTAARQFDATRGVPFLAFAKMRIEGSMRDGVRQRTELPRKVAQKLAAGERGPRGEAPDEDSVRRLNDHVAGLAAAQLAGVLASRGQDTQGEFMAVSAKTTPEDATHRAELRSIVDRCIESLPPEELHLVRRQLEHATLDVIGRELGMTDAKTKALRDRAYDRLKKRVTWEIERAPRSADGGKESAR